MKAHSILDFVHDLVSDEPINDPCTYYAVVSETGGKTPAQNVLGYIRVKPDEMASSVAFLLYRDVHFHLQRCEFPDVVMLQGNVGFIGGNI